MSWVWIVFPLSGYLLGSVPTGVLLGRVAGSDPREAGSGNIGASNVTRVLGKKLGAVTLVLDVLKGLIPAGLGLHFGELAVGALAGGLAVVGHCYPIWLRFKGGKGVATSFGALVLFAPVVTIISAIVWVALVFFTRIPTIGSVTAAALFVLLTRIDERPFEVQLLTLGLFGVILLRHASNLRVLKRRWQKKRR